MKKLEKFFALMLFTLVPALALFGAMLLVGAHWIMATIVGLGMFGFGLDVLLRSKEDKEK